MSLSPGARLGPYEILALLGAGGMGEVYRARDTKLKRDVALKVLPEAFASDPERMARFQHEAEVLASLNHPNIAQIYGVEDRALVMELVEGDSPQGPLSFDDAWKIASQIAAGLEYAHEKGIVHRDLKPANIKITPDGMVKLLDFGLAKAFTGQMGASANPENSPTLTLGATQVGVILGTAAYMAPEQAKGKTVDKRADIWSFGVVLYELLTGERLFTGDDVVETLAAVIHKPPQLERVPAKARRLLADCLQKDPRLRLRDIGDAPRLLDGAAVPAASSRPRLSLALAAAVGVLLVALGLLSFVHFREALPGLPLRYTVAAPVTGAQVLRLAISPDGRYLAMLSAGGVGARITQVWLRPMDELQARPLPTTEGAFAVFWSPDSRYIGFFAQGKLRKIAVTGGPSQPVCDARVSNAINGTWNRDGVILFSEGPSTNFKRVSAEGGAPAIVTGASGLSPIFLPDGRHFLYSRGTEGVWVASLDGKENRRVLAEALPSPALLAPPYPNSPSGNRISHILLRRGTSLVAQPFDVANLQILGEAFPIAENVGTSGAGIPVVTASARGALVFAGGAGGAVGNQLTWYDRTGKSTPVGSPGAVWEPAISPDEKTVAYSRDTGANSDIWLLDVAHGLDRRLTTDPSQNNTPVWSPQGDRVLFRSTRSSRQELYVRSASGAGADEFLPTTSEPKFASQWTHDGVILFNSNSGVIDLWYLPAGQGERKPVKFLHTGFTEAQGQISPDGHWIAFSSNRSGQPEVYVRPFPSGEGESRISATGGEQPRWRGDGKELFFLGGDRKMMAAAVKPPVPGPKPAFDWSAPVPLFDTRIALANTAAFQYDVTKDGKRFLVPTAGSEAAEVAPSLTVLVNWLAGVKK